MNKTSYSPTVIPVHLYTVHTTVSTNPTSTQSTHSQGNKTKQNESILLLTITAIIIVVVVVIVNASNPFRARINGFLPNIAFRIV